MPIHDGIMQFAGEEFVPLWLAFTYLGSNVVLKPLDLDTSGNSMAAFENLQVIDDGIGVGNRRLGCAGRGV